MYGTHFSYQNYQAQTDYTQFLQKKLRDLQNQEQQLIQEAKSIEAWNTLWAQVNDARIDPDHWFINTIDISRSLPWTDLEQLFVFLSNGNPKTTGYWFKPEFLSVTRGAAAAQAPAPGAAGAAGAQGAARPGTPPPARTDKPADDAVETYTFRVRGQFLIPKLGVL
ncbi:MAG: hypothetical protein AB7E47_15475 [Desulfovibrionaceae bacterium]